MVYAGSNVKEEPLDGQRGRKGVSVIPIKSQDDEIVSLHCLHKYKRKELQNFLDEYFSARGGKGLERFFVVRDECKSKARPCCSHCFIHLSFRDLQIF